MAALGAVKKAFHPPLKVLKSFRAFGIFRGRYE
jgi:hypothetical protein